MLLHLACQVIEKAAPAQASHSEEVDAATDEESRIAYIFRAIPRLRDSPASAGSE
jgi:hypothetical protein